MATRLYGLNPGLYDVDSVSEAVGSATTSHNVELTVDLANTIVNDSTITGSTTRTIYKEEVLMILEVFEQYITRSNWPPA